MRERGSSIKCVFHLILLNLCFLIGHSSPWKMWGLVAFIVLLLNLAVMAGMGTLILIGTFPLFSEAVPSLYHARHIILMLCYLIF